MKKLYECSAWIPSKNLPDGSSTPFIPLFRNEWLEADGDDSAYRLCLTKPECGEQDVSLIKFRIEQVRDTN